MLGREGDTQGRHNGVWIPIDAIARVERCVSERIDNVTTLVEVSPSPEQHQLENRTPTVATCPCDVRHHEGWKLERVSLQKWSRKQCKSDNWQLIFLNGSTRSFVDKASVLVLEAYDGCSKIYTTKLANSLVTSAHFIHDFPICYSNSCYECRLSFLPFRVLLGPTPRGVKHTFPFVHEIGHEVRMRVPPHFLVCVRTFVLEPCGVHITTTTHLLDKWCSRRLPAHPRSNSTDLVCCSSLSRGKLGACTCVGSETHWLWLE